MTPDTINGLFEASGAALMWGSIRQVFRDRGYAGFYLPAMVLFTLWGMWNLFYYPHLGQWWSFAGGAFMTVTNTIYIGSMLWFGRKQSCA